MSPTRTGSLSPIALIGFIGALVALLMVGGAGPAYRLNLVDLGGAFSLLRWGAWTGLVVAFIGLIGAWITRPGTPSRGFALALAGVVIAAAAFCVPFAMLQSAKSSPPIHDITTDMENPPRFVAIVPLRTGSANPVEYQGESIAQQQRKAYPDIQPVTIAEPPDVAFKSALNAVRDVGWQIVAATPDERRIEATDTTAWFGFKDDIVVRVTPSGSGSRIDVRSVSRLGQGDLGKNAARIRAYLQRLQH
ncbi:MAG: DUF1499 domain-containing protein [Betaproteobacteria bacterium]|nr:MAG: DUF1499 domain-containing protein [Betaproteobacteria bacterium]